MIESIKSSKIDACFEVFPRIIKDERGAFIKTFHKDTFLQYGLETNFVEEYYSVSRKGVLRGLHFQVPPSDHVKLVYCTVGEVMDVVVDLRLGSPSYGQHEIFYLNSEKANMVYIPKGLAHGFYVMSQEAILMYKVSTMYSPEHDKGILWSSVEVPWIDTNPIVSVRDSQFPSFENFDSPFKY